MEQTRWPCGEELLADLEEICVLVIPAIGICPLPKMLNEMLRANEGFNGLPTGREH